MDDDEAVHLEDKPAADMPPLEAADTQPLPKLGSKPLVLPSTNKGSLSKSTTVYVSDDMTLADLCGAIRLQVTDTVWKTTDVYVRLSFQEPVFFSIVCYVVL
jgi:hypothetical protein